MHSSYPIFDKEQKLLVPSITVAQLGVSNHKYPDKEEKIERTTPTMDDLAFSLAEVLAASTKIGTGSGQIDKLKINYCSEKLLIYSNFQEKIDEDQLKILSNFEEQFETFLGLLALLPEDLKRKLIRRFIESFDELELARIATTDAMTTFKNVVARIVQEFTGRIPGVEASNKAFREHAYWRLINLKICNMCYLDPFICEFSDQYYKLDTTKQKAALEMFFNKLPESVSTKLKEMYNTLLQDGTTIQDTLGARITTLKAWMKQECLQETAKKEAQVKLCCVNAI
ncbi:hypothetical protein Tco_1071102 [Tanacetum coccineum]|uniref:Uncharacterized protein n=1 Tax=Tanacetum coccineum TaxID=301880 RepID=A0ABQ5HQ33_9ASTR